MKRYLLGILFAFLGAVGFASKGIIIKLAYRLDADWLTVLMFRMLFSVPFYIAVIVWHHRKNTISLTNEQKLKIVILGLLGYYLSSLLDFMGLEYITATLERIVLFVYPTMVVVLAAVYHRKKIGNIQKLAILISYLGILVALGSDFGIQKDVLKGSLLVFSAAFTFACYLVFSEKLIAQIGASLYTAYIMTTAAVGIFLHYFLKNGFYIAPLDAQFYELSVLIALFATVFPSFMVSKGISLIGSGNAAIVASVGPVMTILMAYLFLDEQIGVAQILGTVLVLGGVSLITLSKK